MNLLSLIFFVFTFSFVEGQNNICDPGWVYNDGMCYWSSYLALEEGEPSKLANWYGAELTCRSMLAELPYINNTFEASFVQSLAGCGPSWLGLVYSSVYTSNMTDGHWVWWKTNEEASIEVLSGDDDNCTSHLPSAAYLADGKIIADYPDSLHPFICVKRSHGRPSANNCSPDTLPIGYLDEDSTCCNINLLNPNSFSPKWFYYNGKCYIYSNQTIDYFAAQLNCQENNMHLTSIHNQTDNQIVGINSMCGPSWIGLENINPAELCHPDGWAWEDFSGNSLEGSYTNNWFKNNTGQPSCDQPYQNGYIVPFPVSANANAYYWLSYPTYAEIPFICAHNL